MTLASAPFLAARQPDTPPLPDKTRSAVVARITPSDRAQAIFYLKGRLEREKAPMRRQTWLRMIREMETA